MKKLISMMAVAMLTVACFTATAFAAAPAVSVSSDSAAPGEPVTVSVSVSGNTGFASYGMILDYDESALELTAIEAGDKSAGGTFLGNVATGKAGFFAMTDVTGDGVLFTATFKVKDATTSNQTVGVAIEAMTNAGNSSVGASASSGTITVNVPHTHDFAGDWMKDESGHWKQCNCGEKAEFAAHVGEWTVVKEATEDEAGSKTRTCTVCGYVETEEIPALNPGTPVEPGEDPKDEEPKDEDSKADDKIAQTGDNMNFIAMIGMVAVAIAAVAASIVVGKKKGYFQKQ